MKKLKNSLMLIIALGAVTFTSCSKSGSADDSAAQAAADSVAAAEAMADSLAQLEALNVDSTGAATTVAGGASWSSDLDAWVLSGAGTKTITLSGISGEGELSAEGRSQLDLIATILEANPGMKAVIEGHSADGGKPALEKTGSKGRAVWTKAKLVIGHDAAGKNLSTEGLGATKPLAGVDPKDESNKRITVTFTK